MKSLSLTINGIQTGSIGRLEAVCIGANGIVQHIYQFTEANPLQWNVIGDITGPNNQPLSGASELSATVDQKGKIHVIALVGSSYHLSHQNDSSSTVWSNWEEITFIN